MVLGELSKVIQNSIQEIEPPTRFLFFPPFARSFGFFMLCWNVFPIPFPTFHSAVNPFVCFFLELF